MFVRELCNYQYIYVLIIRKGKPEFSAASQSKSAQVDIVEKAPLGVIHYRTGVIWQITGAGSLECLTRSWRAASPNFSLILIDILEKYTIMFNCVSFI